MYTGGGVGQKDPEDTDSLPRNNSVSGVRVYVVCVC